MNTSADLKNQDCAVYLEDPNQDKDPLATKVSEITGAGQIEIEIKEELKIEYECPNKKHKKMCKSLPDTQDSHQIEDESEPLNKKQRRSQNEDTKVQKCPHSTFESDHRSGFKQHTNSYRICTLCNKTLEPDKESVEEQVEMEDEEPEEEPQGEPVKDIQKCFHCSFESDLPRIFKQHTNSYRICSVCNEIFCGTRSAQKFKSHQNTHIIKPNKVHECRICPKSFKYPSELRKHYIWSACGKQVDY